MNRAVLSLLGLLPKNALSLAVGKLCYLHLPASVTKEIIGQFVKLYGVDLTECEKPVSEYPSLGDFFARNLKPGSRAIGMGVVSPVDGVLREFGPLRGEKLTQIKGIDYPVTEFLGNETTAKRFVNGYFLSFYLSPPDYHHIHSPVDGEIVEVIHLPGTLWPVNDLSVSCIENLYCLNERIAVIIRTKCGDVAVVAVGATNVGSISLAFADFVTNDKLKFKPASAAARKCLFSGQTWKIKKGERIASFRLGSSVVLLFEPGTFMPASLRKNMGCRYGSIIGNFSGEDSGSPERE